jgi:predicted dehydrogenase
VANWLKTQANYPIDIVAVCDVYRPRAQNAARAFGCKAYMSHKELLADPRVDVVCIATPDHHHGYQAIDAVRAGKHVYCEKPVTHWRQFNLVKQLAAEVKKSGRTFQLGTQGMSDAAWHTARKLIADGLIGQPIHAECGYFRVGDWGERGMPIDDPKAQPGPDLDWEAFLGDAPRRPFNVSRFFRWRMYEDYAGGPVTDLYPHSLTPVVSMLGVTFPSVVVATGGMYRYTEREVPDSFNVLIDYPQKLTIVLMGTQGNNYFGTVERGSPGRAPIIRGWEGTLTFAGGQIAFWPAEGSKKPKQTFPIKGGENLTTHWQNFLDACRKGSQDTFSPADLAYHTQTALLMGAWSQKQGKIARFDPQRSQHTAHAARAVLPDRGERAET